MANERPEFLEPIAAPRFRLLIVGKTGAGKTSLINQAFGVDLHESHRFAGKHNIEDEIISPSNDMFILHDSEGFERLRPQKSGTVQSFIEQRLDQREPKDQLHAIWLCSSLSAPSPFDRSDEQILINYSDRLPVVMVFTKLDVLEDVTRVSVSLKYPDASQEDVDRIVKDEVEKLQNIYFEQLRQITGKANYPHAKVSVRAPHGTSVRNLVETTQQLLTNKFGLRNNSAALGSSIAQRANPDDKVTSSIEIVLKGALGSLESKASFDDRLRRVDEDLIRIWNFEDHGNLLSQPLRLQKLRNGVELGNTDDFIPVQKRILVLGLMKYVTDLILILRMIFYNTRTSEGIRPLAGPLIDMAFDIYIEQQRQPVHAAIDQYASTLEDSMEVSSHSAAQHVRDLISGDRLSPHVDIPYPPVQRPSAKNPSPRPASDAKTPEGESKPISIPSAPDAMVIFLQAGADDADVLVGSLQLKVKHKRFIITKRSACTLKVIQTHQTFFEVKKKSLAFLAFCLEHKTAEIPQLLLEGNLRDTGSANEQAKITNVWPHRHTENYHTSTVERSESNTVTLTGGFPPRIQLGFSPTRTKAWSEGHSIVDVDFEPRRFEMRFSPRPQNKHVPGILPFAVLVTYPGSRAPFDLDFQISSGDTPSHCSITCDGETEITKAANPVR